MTNLLSPQFLFKSSAVDRVFVRYCWGVFMWSHPLHTWPSTVPCQSLIHSVILANLAASSWTLVSSCFTEIPPHAHELSLQFQNSSDHTSSATNSLNGKQHSWRGEVFQFQSLKQLQHAEAGVLKNVPEELKDGGSTPTNTNCQTSDRQTEHKVTLTHSSLNGKPSCNFLLEVSGCECGCDSHLLPLLSGPDRRALEN